MKQTLRDLAEQLGCRLLGDSSITVTSVSSLQSATSGNLVFVEDAQHLDAALGSAGAAAGPRLDCRRLRPPRPPQAHPDFRPAAPHLRPSRKASPRPRSQLRNSF